MELLRKLTHAPESAQRAVAATLKGIGRTGRHTYPFGNPVSVERCHVDVIKQLPYWVAEKTDGVRVALICVSLPGTTEAASYIMDRVGRLYGFPIAAAKTFFDGSVFDAELVCQADNEMHTLLVFDVACLRGDGSIGSKPLSARLKAIHGVFLRQDDTRARDDAVLSNRVVSIRRDVRVAAKDMYRLEDGVEAVHAAMKTLRHASDGYILTPEQGGASLPGTAWSTYKIKSAHTIDLLWTSGTLWYGEGETLFPITDLRLAGMVRAPQYDATEFKAYAGCIVEVTPEVTDGCMTLSFLKLRTDRDAPNNVVCVTRTLKSALDAVTIVDVCKERRPDAGMAPALVAVPIPVPASAPAPAPSAIACL